MARALFAGVIATAIVSVLVYVNDVMGLVPQFDFLSELRSFNARLGLPVAREALWITHGVLGVVALGFVYAVLEPILPGRGLVSGLVFGVVTWLTMMVAFMPLAGHALFAQDLGPLVIAAALGLNLVYGGALGATFASLSRPE